MTNFNYPLQSLYVYYKLPHLLIIQLYRLIPFFFIIKYIYKKYTYIYKYYVVCSDRIFKTILCLSDINVLIGGSDNGSVVSFSIE